MIRSRLQGQVRSDVTEGKRHLRDNIEQLACDFLCCNRTRQRYLGHSFEIGFGLPDASKSQTDDRGEVEEVGLGHGSAPRLSESKRSVCLTVHGTRGRFR